VSGGMLGKSNDHRFQRELAQLGMLAASG